VAQYWFDWDRVDAAYMLWEVNERFLGEWFSRNKTWCFEGLGMKRVTVCINSVNRQIWLYYQEYWVWYESAVAPSPTVIN
jgi:hypothetical protein